MSALHPRRRDAPLRIVSGPASVMRAGSTEGRTLFPSFQFSHWPPFKMLVETWMNGGEVPDPHPHVREEVVTYVLSGSLEYFDERRRSTPGPAGSVGVLTAPREMVHDISPPAGTRTHWLTLILQWQGDAPVGASQFRTGTATPLPGMPPGVSELGVVGEGGPVQSGLGLELRDVQLADGRETELSVGEHRSALVYVLDGHVRAAQQDLPAGSGLLADGLPALAAAGIRPSRLIFATVMRPGEPEGS